MSSAGLLVGFLVESSVSFRQFIVESDPHPGVGAEVKIPVLGAMRAAVVTQVRATTKVDDGGYEYQPVTHVRWANADSDAPDVKLTAKQVAGLQYKLGLDVTYCVDDEYTTDPWELLDLVGAKYGCEMSLVGRDGGSEGFGLVGITVHSDEWIAARARAGLLEPANQSDELDLNSDGCSDDLDVLAEVRPALVALRAKLVAAGFEGLPARAAAHAIPEEG